MTSPPHSRDAAELAAAGPVTEDRPHRAPFPKPVFDYDYQVEAQRRALRTYRDTKEGRAIRRGRRASMCGRRKQLTAT